MKKSFTREVAPNVWVTCVATELDGRLTRVEYGWEDLHRCEFDPFETSAAAELRYPALGRMASELDSDHWLFARQFAEWLAG